MMYSNHGKVLPVSLLFTAALLVLCTNFFASHNVSTVFTTSLHSCSLHNLSTDGDTASANALTSDKTSDALARKKAVSFGHRDVLVHNSSRHANVARAEPITLTYATAVKKGQEYWQALAGTRKETLWRSYADLIGNGGPYDSYGWSVYPGKKVADNDDSFEVPFLDPFIDLDIPLEPKYNKEARATQDLLFFNCRGVKCAPTLATNWATYNPVGKTIVSQKNFAPNYMLRRRLKVQQLSNEQAENLPRVTQWSDIVWLVWALQCITPEQASELKYIFKENIITSDTQFIMEKCVPNTEPDALDIEWPGMEFTPEDEQFYALLGTPHGRGIAFLVFQHPNELPGKSIESITVFTIDGLYHLLFTLTGPGNPPIDHSPPPQQGSPPGLLKS